MGCKFEVGQQVKLTKPDMSVHPANGRDDYLGHVGQVLEVAELKISRDYQVTIECTAAPHGKLWVRDFQLESVN